MVKKAGILFSIVLVLGIWAQAGIADVPGQISFQGQLTSRTTGLEVADGDYSMRFYLFDAAVGGIQLWNSPDGEEQDVSVADGIYNIFLGDIHPLTADMLDSGNVWLQVTIYNPDTTDWEVLSPRIALSSVAYAIKAGDSDTLEGLSAAAFSRAGHDHDARYVNESQAGAITTSMLASGSVGSASVADNSLTAGDLADDSVTASEIAEGAVGSSEIADGSVTAKDLADGAAINEIQDDDGSGSGLDADFLDGLNSSDFVQPKQDYGRSGVAGNLYEGTMTLTSKYVNESGDTMDGSLSINTPGSALFLDATPADYFIYGINLDVDQSRDYDYHTYGLYTLVNSSAPTSDVYGSRCYVDKDAGTGYTYGSYLNAEHRGTSGYLYGSYVYAKNYTGSNSGTYGYYANTVGAAQGNVYGIFSSAFKSDTDTGGTTYGGYFTSANNSSGNSYGMKAEASGEGGANYGVQALASNGNYNYALWGAAGSGINNWAGYFYGKVGIDISGSGNNAQSVVFNPDNYTMEMYNSADDPTISLDSDAYTISMNNSAGGRTLLLDSGATSGSALNMYDDSGTLTVAIDSESGTNGGPYLYFYNNTGKTTIYIDGESSSDDGYISIRDADGNPTIILDGDYSGTGDGRITTDELQITGGSDLSEQFDVFSRDIEVAPGMVVSIDPETPGNLKVSHTEYDNKVAGIISGANGIKTGMMMGQKGTKADGQHPVALTGRVYCWADTSAGPIRPGDLLTTSNIPGHAMKVNDHTRAIGAILGKAMTALDKDRGLVLVLVSLQ